MKLVKKLMLSDRVHDALSWLIHAYLSFVFRTTSWTFEGEAEAMERIGSPEEQGFIVSLWHNRVSMMPFIWDSSVRKLTILNSSHRDGQLVSKVMKLSDVESIPVSSKTVNMGAARQVMRIIKGGDCIGVTPDGPRGPRREMKALPLEWARLCKCDLAVITYSVKYRIVLKSWDRFIIPLPFNKGIFIWKKAFQVPRDADEAELERLRIAYETLLDDVTDEADRRVGCSPEIRD